MGDGHVLVTTSWDDGHELDNKLASMLDRVGMAGTFYVAPQSREVPEAERLTPSALRDLSTRFEIGGHTLSHPHLTRLAPTDAEREIRDGKAALEDVVGHRLTSFCYPYGAYRSEHVRMTSEAGFDVARTTERFNTAAPHNPLEMPTAVHAVRHRADARRVVRFGSSPRQWWATWSNWDVLAGKVFAEACASNGVFHLWGHSWEIEANDDWSRLETFLRSVIDHPRVRTVTNAELVGHLSTGGGATNGC